MVVYGLRASFFCVSKELQLSIFVAVLITYTCEVDLYPSAFCRGWVQVLRLLLAYTLLLFPLYVKT